MLAVFRQRDLGASAVSRREDPGLPFSLHKRALKLTCPPEPGQLVPSSHWSAGLERTHHCWEQQHVLQGESSLGHMTSRTRLRLRFSRKMVKCLSVSVPPGMKPEPMMFSVLLAQRSAVLDLVNLNLVVWRSLVQRFWWQPCSGEAWFNM